MYRRLINFLFQIAEQIGIEEFRQFHIQSIANLLNGGDGSGIVSSADDIVDGGLSHAAFGAKTIDG